MEEKSTKIKSLVTEFCNQHLDKNYLETCTKVFDDLMEEDEDVFKRGKEEVWAASVVWSVGSENFLSDKSFKPYSTLADVCSFFGTNSSTVGQKTRKIKDKLDMNIWSPEYRLTGSELGNFIDSLVLTENGIIVPANMLEEEDIEDSEEIEEDELTFYKIFFGAKGKVTNAQVYQLEYTLKKLLAKDEKFEVFKKIDNRKLNFVFFGWWETVEKITETIRFTNFEITDIYYADNLKDLD